MADGSLSPVDAAKEIITEFWRNAWEQPRWAYLFAEGLIDTKTADAWADEVWCQLMEEETDEEEELEDRGAKRYVRFPPPKADIGSDKCRYRICRKTHRLFLILPEAEE